MTQPFVCVMEAGVGYCGVSGQPGTIRVMPSRAAVILIWQDRREVGRRSSSATSSMASSNVSGVPVLAAQSGAT